MSGAGGSTGGAGVTGEPGVGDFDFFVGSWHGIQRRLAKPLAECTEWDAFPSTTECFRLFDGAANMDELTAADRGFKGVSLRLFDPAREEWSIYWANSRNGLLLLLLPPVVGRFTDGVGLFCSDEIYEGTSITVRFKWSEITPVSARWEQAFSADGGTTWETNWIADFTRRAG
jgi:hypothetical protein